MTATMRRDPVIIGDCTLYQGDCIEIMADMSAKSVTLTLTDIPYGAVNKVRGAKKQIGTWLRQLHKGAADEITFTLKDFIYDTLRITTGSLYVFCGIEQISELFGRFIQEVLLARLLVWEKTKPLPMNAEKFWMSGVEFCVFGRFRKAVFNDFYRNCVIRAPNGSRNLHPTQKNLAVITDMLVISTNSNDTVFDPCMGSGTTGVAAVQNGRKFIGIEKDAHWFDVACKRIEAAYLEQQGSAH